MENNLVCSINMDGELNVVDDALYAKLVSFCISMGMERGYRESLSGV